MMAASISFPPLTRAVVDTLDKRFPERTPDPSWSDREIWMRAGERRVIRFINAQFEEQQKGI